MELNELFYKALPGSLSEETYFAGCARKIRPDDMLKEHISGIIVIFYAFTY
ncbi:MAG: hypothetical protein WC980_03925 [Candidatus Brocadiia bacterium]